MRVAAEEDHHWIHRPADLKATRIDDAVLSVVEVALRAKRRQQTAS
jgi:hypothetical protein